MLIGVARPPLFIRAKSVSFEVFQYRGRRALFFFRQIMMTSSLLFSLLLKWFKAPPLLFFFFFSFLPATLFFYPGLDMYSENPFFFADSS